MKTAIDSTGRVLIPKALRARASLTPGTVFEARYEDGCIVLEPAALEVRIQKKGLFFVADASYAVEPLRAEDVEREIEALRGEPTNRTPTRARKKAPRPKSRPSPRRGRG